MMVENRGGIYRTASDDRREAIAALFEVTELVSRLAKHRQVLIKPNLVEALDPPITTPVELVEEIVIWLQGRLPDLKILVGEGTGAINYDTDHCFDVLGYTQMAARRGIELIDLNLEPYSRREDPRCTRWPSLYLPKILDHCFLLSVPVLKAHSLAGVTLTMKNMMGCAPPAKYREGNSWGKSAFHRQLQEAVFDLNLYRTPDFTLLDASIGMAEAHLWGAHCTPPIGLLVAGFDPVAIDSYGAHLLGRRWQEIGHIALAEGVLGKAWQGPEHGFTEDLAGLELWG
jgi:uncharacterized protein (DUF362 family)